MPNNWKKYTLNDISRIGDGAHAKVERKDSGILYLTSKNFKEGKLVLDKVDFICEEDYEKLFSINSKAIRRPQTDDIILGIIGTIGNAYCYKASDKFGISSSVALIRPDSEIVLSKYLYYYIISNTFKHYQNSHNGASVQGYTNIPSLKSIPIELPHLQEQKAIAEILSSLDDKIELNLQTNKTLEEIANALYKHWFVDFGPFQNGKFVESELGLIPEGWEISRLENVVDIGSSKRIFLNEYVSSGIPFYRGKEIIELSKNNSINTELFIDINKFEDIKARFGAPKEGDILLTSVGTIGKSYLIGADEVFYFKDGNLTWIKNYLSYLKPHFVFQWLNSIETLEQIQSIKIGSTQEAITIQGIRSLKIIVPPKSVHDEVEINIREYRNLIKSNNCENDSLKQTRDYLLPKLISGEIRVKYAAKKIKEVL
jgi:type I restriction enzyme S subunit